MGMCDDLLRAMKKGEVTVMMLADFSKAFDTVNYKVLITKLSTLGFSKPFLCWLNSYLSDRSHFVQIDDRTSESVNVGFGCYLQNTLNGNCSKRISASTGKELKEGRM